MPRRNPFALPGSRRKSRIGNVSNKGPKSPFANAMYSGPPKAIEIKTPQVDVEGLKDAYSWMVVSKDLGFRLVIEWYATNTPHLLYKDPLEADRQKAYDRAMASVKLAESTHASEERDTAYRTALRLFNTRVWPSKGLLTLGEGEALTEPTEKVKQVQTVLSTLNTAFTGKVQFRMSMLEERQFLAGEILLPKTELEALIPKTPLQIVLNEVPTVAKVLSIESTPEGDKLNGAKFMETLPVLNNEIALWAMTDRTLVSKTIGKASASDYIPRQRVLQMSTVSSSPTEPRPNSKAAQVIAMLKRGTTIQELMTSMTWQEHTTRAMLSAGGAIRKKYGMTITKSKVQGTDYYQIP
jgi:Protein of unknown function (DUF3489)